MLRVPQLLLVLLAPASRQSKLAAPSKVDSAGSTLCCSMLEGNCSLVNNSTTALNEALNGSLHMDSWGQQALIPLLGT